MPPLRPPPSLPVSTVIQDPGFPQRLAVSSDPSKMNVEYSPERSGNRSKNRSTDKQKTQEPSQQQQQKKKTKSKSTPIDSGKRKAAGGGGGGGAVSFVPGEEVWVSRHLRGKRCSDDHDGAEKKSLRNNSSQTDGSLDSGDFAEGFVSRWKGVIKEVRSVGTGGGAGGARLARDKTGTSVDDVEEDWYLIGFTGWSRRFDRWERRENLSRVESVAPRGRGKRDDAIDSGGDGGVHATGPGLPSEDDELNHVRAGATFAW